MVNITGSFVSPSADATVSPRLFVPAGILTSVLDGFNVWKLLVTLFVGAVLYDQCKCDCSPKSPGALETRFKPFSNSSSTVKYHYLKGAIIGPAYKIPFMGPFLQSVNPKFHEYKAKWDSGELSCVSVFHK